jgi:hypothetical protein
MLRTNRQRRGRAALLWALAGGLLVLGLAAACGPVDAPAPLRSVSVSAEARVNLEVLAARDSALAQRLGSGRLVPWQADGAGAATLPLPPGFTQRMSVRAPTSGTEALEVTASGLRVRFRPVGARADSRLDTAGTYGVYAKEYPATDGFVVHGGDFLEVLYLLEGEGAPKRFAWAVEADARLQGFRRQADGSAALVNGAETAVLHIPAPVAVDAQGKRVPCRLEADGRRLAVVLPDEALTYPVLVDPVVETPGWTDMTPASLFPRAKHAMATLGTKVVLFGGRMGRHIPI